MSWIGPMSNLREGVLSRIEPEPTSGCWLWTGASTGAGYGWSWDSKVKKGVLAHRLVYNLLVGPIAEGLTLDHLCRNRICVSPWHLEPVTYGENVRRGELAKTNRARAAAITHCPQGHEYTETNTYLCGAKRTCRACTTANNQRRDRRAR